MTEENNSKDLVKLIIVLGIIVTTLAALKLFDNRTGKVASYGQYLFNNISRH